MYSAQESHSSMILKEWHRFTTKIKPNAGRTIIDGHNLDVATVVAVARHAVPANVHASSLSNLIESREALEANLGQGIVIYGVNTGFGGSADTRTNQVDNLQRSLIRMLQYGILASPQDGGTPTLPLGSHKANGVSNGTTDGTTSGITNGIISGITNGTVNGTVPEPDTVSILTGALSLDDSVVAACMPEAWVRAAILIRINSLIHGHSAVRPVVVERLRDLLIKDIVPRIPLHGSISASGDLSPLSYIGGVLQGEPNLNVMMGDRNTGKRRVAPASIALAQEKLEPVKLAAKEGLAIVNGTAMSCAAGTLAMHDAHGLAVLSQVLTAMSVEALCGTSESFDPFFAAVRPHPGQVESSHNVFNFLNGSKLAAFNDGSDGSSLRQDRYSIRTVSQWIGPVLEDLLLAHKQITVECNSVTDNPLINSNGTALHGGNFQAKAVTSAMEKARQGVQTIGRMLFAQCTELINPATNRGLPPNLVPDEPSESFIMKGVDIMVAALQSELGFLANPVNHVHTAEMGNQALNSLALISARYTHTALDLLSKLASAHLFTLCQALDLRAMHERFLEQVAPQFQALVHDKFHWITDTSASNGEEEWNKLNKTLWDHLIRRLDKSTTMDSAERFLHVAHGLQSVIFEATRGASAVELVDSLRSFTEQCSSLLLTLHRSNRDHYLLHGDATSLLGAASKRMYTFVRRRLKVPFITTKDLLTPTAASSSDRGVESDSWDPFQVPTVGSLITKIYTAVKSGALLVPVMESLEEARGCHDVSASKCIMCNLGGLDGYQQDAGVGATAST